MADSVQRDRRLRHCAFFPLRRDASMIPDAARAMASLVKAARRKPFNVPGHLRNIVTGARDLAG